MRKIYKPLAVLSSILAFQGLNAQCPTPSSVMATPSLLCSGGGTTNLNATAAGSNIRWFQSPTGGVPTGTSASGANFSVNAVNTTTYYAESFTLPNPGGALTLNYTGAPQLIEIPAGVNQITVDCRGARGNNGGYGGRAYGVMTVTPGQILYVYVGGQGTGTMGGYNGGANGGTVTNSNYNGGGGGGASDIRINGNTLTDRIIVAAGGGGNTYYWGGGGNGGSGGFCNSPNGFGGGQGYGYYSGQFGSCSGGAYVYQGCGGNGGGLNSGGAATGSGNGGLNGLAGTFGQGGNGGAYQPDGAGGGGGGGYYGGGGGAANGYYYYCGAGAGGSSYIDNAVFTNTLNQGGYQFGNGQVIITGLSGGCNSASRTAVSVSVVPTPTLNITGGTASVCAGGAVTLTANGAQTYTWTGGTNSATSVFNPTANTVYTVTGANYTCTSMATKEVSVHANFLQIAGTGVICKGTSLQLQASGGLTYTWQPGNLFGFFANVTPTASTTYTLHGYTSTGCNYSTSANVTVNALPSVSITGNSSICIGQTAVLAANGADSYVWSTGATTQSILVNPNTATSYTATGTNTASGCSNTSVFNLLVDPCTGINEENVVFANLSLYPNPNNGELTVKLDNGQNKEIVITDVTGRVVASLQSELGLIHFDMHNLSQGVYYVKVSSENKSQTSRVIKQ